MKTDEAPITLQPMDNSASLICLLLYAKPIFASICAAVTLIFLTGAITPATDVLINFPPANSIKRLVALAEATAVRTGSVPRSIRLDASLDNR
ncbi:unannotated protein [freshwater metagenome]|uniref:Unannotated protein n=1 Tax=freshwater metagenome TaxID=449393 RepID=A0A6J7W1D0_9ZZZZ